jgi:hypothetical protein
MFGGDLPTNDAFTLDLTTNEEVLAVDQKALKSREIFNRENQIAWTSDVPGSTDKDLTVFNVADSGEAAIQVNGTLVLSTCRKAHALGPAVSDCPWCVLSAHGGRLLHHRKQ